MQLNAVAVSSKDLKKTVDFYKLLGFEFPEIKEEVHVESINDGQVVRLMIDSTALMKDLLGQEPIPGNHSSFAVQYDTPQEVDAVTEKIKSAGFTISKEAWDAFWGQRYAVAEDPDGHKVDLYATLNP